MAIGFERENVFKVHPHPDLLHLEKGQHEEAFGLSEGLCD
jgi:hypothetical protein